MYPKQSPNPLTAGKPDLYSISTLVDVTVDLNEPGKSASVDANSPLMSSMSLLSKFPTAENVPFCPPKPAPMIHQSSAKCSPSYHCAPNITSTTLVLKSPPATTFSSTFVFEFV